MMHYEVNKSHSQYSLKDSPHFSHGELDNRKNGISSNTHSVLSWFSIFYISENISATEPRTQQSDRDPGPPKPAKMSVTVSPLVCLMSFTLNRDRQPCLSLNIRIRIYFPARLWRIMRYFVFWSDLLSSHHIKRWRVTEQIWWVSEAGRRQLMISR